MKKNTQVRTKIEVWNVVDEKQALKMAIKSYPGWWITEIELSGIPTRGN